ncbi:MAG: NADPH:quinone reductase Zn-dependent oxidoreductase [Candidatus Gottesmanbacteria bacterium GW2011_GWA1_42_26]|nr:MAG: NADPH:quinone reductase Zn-dependent oxidoreductase [Candidatus Gottesmanbacteria bacterium GW2011_GWA2_42_16]KKS51575.1 MAG: NADPH:quinone reductase Zn-dependent oxidoreductase [Candidatus Gottesmanbacteria bacterium GW2011_GWA1_42_26]
MIVGIQGIIKYMKAVQVNAYGGPEVLEFKENISTPVPQKGQVLVEVHAVGLNPFDLKVLSGAYQKMIPLQFPMTFGGDLAGIITELGEGVSDLKVGDQVFGSAITLKGGSGALAEFATAKAETIAPMPHLADFSQAAALPVAGLTAVEALADQANLQKDQKILIHGGAGGVGHFAIQYAKHLGAYVATTVRGRDADFVKGLGADEIIDYKTQAFAEILKDFDVVLDTIGGSVSDKSYQVLKKGGTLILLVSQVNEELAKTFGIKTIRQQTKTDSPQLKRLAELVDTGVIKIHIDRMFPLEQMKDAYTHLQSGHPQGKVIVKIK